MRLCVIVCARARAREREEEKERDRGRPKELNLEFINSLLLLVYRENNGVVIKYQYCTGIAFRSGIQLCLKLIFTL